VAPNGVGRHAGRRVEPVRGVWDVIGGGRVTEKRTLLTRGRVSASMAVEDHCPGPGGQAALSAGDRVVERRRLSKKNS